MTTDDDSNGYSSDSSYSKVNFYEVINDVPEEFQWKVDELNKILKNENDNIDKLKELAISEGGLVISLIRSEVWPLFLGLSNQNKQLLNIETIKGHPEYNQVEMDVRRCLKRFPPGILPEEIGELQIQLIEIILSIIIEHPELKYYQGFHDVAVTFLIEVRQEKAYILMEQLSLIHLREFLMPTMEQTSYLLWHVFPLISKNNVKLESYLSKAGIGTIFALPWLLSWFSHSLDQHKKVVRLFDYFLASPKEIILYVIAQLVISKENDILKTECDMACIHLALSKIPDDLDFETILLEATKMYKKYPPSTLKDEVELKIQQEKESMKKIQEQYKLRKHSKHKGTVGQRLPFAYFFNYVPIWMVPRMRYSLLFFGFSVVAALWAMIKSIDKRN